jgi:uncharacterized alkaline shock family protein YloU
VAAAVNPQVRLHVDERAVASIAADAARRVPGVVALRPALARALVGLAGSLGRPRSASDGVDVAVADEEGAATAAVTVTVATRLGHNCRDLAAAVQQAVTLAVSEQTGLAAHVQVTVAEVLLN